MTQLTSLSFRAQREIFRFKRLAGTQAFRQPLSINVPKIGQVLPFYMRLFDAKPCKMRDDYVKFELDDPPVNLTLNLHPMELASAKILAIDVIDARAIAAYVDCLDRMRAIRERGPGRLLAQDTFGDRAS